MNDVSLSPQDSSHSQSSLAIHDHQFLILAWGNSNSRLWLRDVHDGTRHATNQHHATRGISVHQVLCNAGGKKIGAVNIDIPELSHTIDWVVDCLKVLGKASAGDQVIDLSMLLEDIVNTGLD